jgi:hypothetical protein
VYFITICAQDRACLFGEVVDGEMCVSDAGRMIASVWNDIPVFYPGVETGAFIVMPNHVHGIIILVGAAPRGRPDECRPDECRPDQGQAQGPAPTSLLLSSLARIERYIEEDPLRWDTDRENPGRYRL